MILFFMIFFSEKEIRVGEVINLLFIKSYGYINQEITCYDVC
jgi:hypothetical protein